MHGARVVVHAQVSTVVLRRTSRVSHRGYSDEESFSSSVQFFHPGSSKHPERRHVTAQGDMQYISDEEKRPCIRECSRKTPNSLSVSQINAPKQPLDRIDSVLIRSVHMCVKLTLSVTQYLKKIRISGQFASDVIVILATSLKPSQVTDSLCLLRLSLFFIVCNPRQGRFKNGEIIPGFALQLLRITQIPR